ncbi:ABC transporter substrate-binding protein [Loigolactobacillus binensis]|uniref:ABC transporter substrate-binding protein n=1 Tax=Loigolactobacillus binensis TaxID=2559922 RepID=A0ABW3EB51_9LACO|nr:ABC transporter substrate-binding protein [Loigolactobacillus binensis]
MKKLSKAKWIKAIVTILAIVTLVVPLAGCGSSSSSSSKSSQVSKTITITDQAGDKVTVPKKIKRIAVAGILPLPSFLTVFFNSASKLVGIPKASMIAAKSGLLSELYPDILKAKTNYDNGDTVNTEELKKLNPDVVFYSANNPALKKQLKNAGFTAVGISVDKWHYNTIETQKHWIALLSKMFPQNNKAKIVNNYSDKMYNLVQKRVKNISADKKQKVFFLFQYSNSMIATSSDKFFGQYWADAVGATNVGETLKTDNATTVNMEQIYKWNPQKIFITNFTTAQPNDLYNNKIGNYDWSKVAAVKNKQVYKMPLGMYRSYTPGVDTPITLLWMAKTVYPDQFKDINIIKETKTYYKKVFNVNLTDKQAQKIFTPPASASAY